MTAATPERPLNVEKLRRLTPEAITAIGRGDSVNVVLVPADRWPAILAALEGLWRVQAVAEDAVAALDFDAPVTVPGHQAAEYLRRDAAIRAKLAALDEASDRG